MTGRALESLQQSWSTAMGCSWASMCVHTLLFRVQAPGKTGTLTAYTGRTNRQGCIKGGP